MDLSYPFELFVPDHGCREYKRSGEKVLHATGCGGIRRYEDDRYNGGNSWILTTLWYALEANRREESEKVKEVLEWVLANQTSTGLLPEQIDKEKGGPVWVVPLTWSHAMFVLIIQEFYGN